jgi:DNA-binding NarL/FixJ family response regulator
MNSNPTLPSVPCIFLSGSYDEDAVRRAFAEGAEGWYVKGVDEPSAIIDAVKRLHDGPTK